jgi:hypothetical protein
MIYNLSNVQIFLLFIYIFINIVTSQVTEVSNAQAQPYPLKASINSYCCSNYNNDVKLLLNCTILSNIGVSTLSTFDNSNSFNNPIDIDNKNKKKLKIALLSSYTKDMIEYNAYSAAINSIYAEHNAYEVSIYLILISIYLYHTNIYLSHSNIILISY